MSQIRKNEKGFSILEMLIILVVVVAIGAVGYLVYKHEDTKKTVTTTTSNKITSATPSNTTLTTSSVTTYRGYNSSPANVQNAIINLANLYYKTTDITTNTCPSNSQPGGVLSPNTAPIFYERSGKFIAFTVGCDYVAIVVVGAYVNGSWNLVFGSAGEGSIPCNVLTKYNVPIDILKIPFSPSYSNGHLTCDNFDTSTNSYDVSSTYEGPTTN